MEDKTDGKPCRCKNEEHSFKLLETKRTFHDVGYRGYTEVVDTFYCERCLKYQSVTRPSIQGRSE